MPAAGRFLFTTCQVGAEGALKGELARRWPEFRFAYSRPGFVTFKIPPERELAGDFDLQSVFARAYGLSLGRVRGKNAEELARAAVELLDAVGQTEAQDAQGGTGGGRTGGEVESVEARPSSSIDLASPREGWQRLHVWQRDPVEMGHHGFEPMRTTQVAEAEQAFTQAVGLSAEQTGLATPGERVLDCVVIDGQEWWLGWHVVRSTASRWPGGIFSLEPTVTMVSRAYLKMREALAWSRLPVRKREWWVEIGSAPGGASQALLERGLNVIGIDPAEMDPEILAHPHFEHWKKRGADVKRREFGRAKWLSVDVNVAPSYTLEMVESIVTHKDVAVEGLLLTLKLLDWNLAAEIPDYLARIRAWGYEKVRARQLSHNRQEICVAALRS